MTALTNSRSYTEDRLKSGECRDEAVAPDGDRGDEPWPSPIVLELGAQAADVLIHTLLTAA
jgi:hypothetical protein